MPYVHRKYAKCKECEDTNTLFLAKNKLLKDGTRVIRISRVCRPCNLVKQSESNEKIHSKNKEKYLAQKREYYRKNKEMMRERSRVYHHKNKEDQNRKRMIRHEKTHKKVSKTKEQKFVKKMQNRVSLGNRENFYLREKI